MNVCWNLTNMCNEDCIYCFRELIETPLSLEENLRIIDKLTCIGVNKITFSGGEPLLYSNLEELLKYAKLKGIEIALITNGTLLNKDNLKNYLSYLDKLTFSMDSPSEYVNESSGRGKRHYQHIKELLPIIVENFPDLTLEVNTVATNLSLNEIEFMFDALGNELSCFGIKKWKISRFCPLRGFALLRKDYLSITDETFMKIKEIYDGKKAMFEISVRDLESFDAALIISPSGHIKKAENSEEFTIIDDLKDQEPDEVKKKLGGYYV